MGRLNKRLGIQPQNEEEQRQYEEEIIRQQQQYEEYLRQQQQQHQPQPKEEPEEDEDDEYESYKDIPIKKAIDIKRTPTPKGYFPTVISGIPVDLHALEEYIVKTSPFSIKTLLRYDSARNIEEIKNYSTRTTGKKKADAKFFLLLMLAVCLLVGGVVVIFFMPELIAMFKGMAP